MSLYRRRTLWLAICFFLAFVAAVEALYGDPHIRGWFVFAATVEATLIAFITGLDR